MSVADWIIAAINFLMIFSDPGPSWPSRGTNTSEPAILAPADPSAMPSTPTPIAVETEEIHEP